MEEKLKAPRAKAPRKLAGGMRARAGEDVYDDVPARRGEVFSTRVSDEFQALVVALVDAVSKSVGTRVSKAQALEIAVREALARRGAEQASLFEQVSR